MLKDKDGNDDPIYTAYYGIKNVPDINTRGESVIATVYCENGSNIASVVYIDASSENTLINTSDEDYVYVLYDPAVTSKYDAERGRYWTYDAIVNGEYTVTIQVNEKTYRGMDPRAALDDNDPNKQAWDNGEIEDMNPRSTLFTNIQVDDFDIYSLEEPQPMDQGVKRVQNDVLSIGQATNYTNNLVISENCKVFFIDAKGAVSEITVPAVIDDDYDYVTYSTDTDNNVVCVVIDEAPNA